MFSFYSFRSIAAILLSLSLPVEATVLGDAAAQLSPGQWAKVSGMINLNGTASEPAWQSGFGTAGPGYDGSQPAWDSATGKLYIETSEHGFGVPGDCGESNTGNFPAYPHTCWKPLWIYDDTTNSWSVNNAAPLYPNGNPVPGVHVWGGIAWDNVNKVLYIKQFYFGPKFSIEIFRYCVNSTPSYCAAQGAGQWAQLPDFYPPNASAVGEQLGWHPTLNGGTLLYYDTGGAGGTCGALFGYTEGQGWRTIDSGANCKFSGGATMINAQISTAKGVVLFGPSGSSYLQWWRINSAGAIAELDPAPCAFISTNGGFSQAGEDPNTGNIYFIGCTPAGQLWKLNPTGATGSQWTQVSSALNSPSGICNIHRFSTEPCGTDFYATPISNYGIIGFWKYRATSPPTAEYWIYKPSVAGPPDVTLPTVSVSAPSAGATVSGTSVTVSANASDNIGVVGVQFKLDGVNLGAEDTTIPYSISWNTTTASNGNHILTATARDLAGNTATSTNISVTVSNVVDTIPPTVSILSPLDGTVWFADPGSK
jgi:hypothetical protein